MPPPVARRMPYKDFLQPALQRRFAGTAALILGLSYLEALTLSKWNSIFWSWNPLGLPGLRALGIFLCVLPIVVLRIARAHMGRRTSNSFFEILTNLVFLFSTFETILTYLISAFVFSQIYLMSTPEDVGIRWITRATGRARLNEQAVFYTVSILLMGLVQGVFHLAWDQDRLLLGTVKTTRREGPEGREDDAANTRAAAHWASKIGDFLPTVAVRSVIVAVGTAMFNYLALYSFIRISSWRSAMWFFRFFYSDLPRYNFPIGSAPWSLWMLGRTIWASFLLGLLWQFGGVAFRAQLTREPLKKEQPLTSESKDPTGSLVNGLQSKKPRIHAFAMWELAFIARDYKARRQAIFEDIDRKDGTMWSQICAVCLDTIKSIERRVDDYGKPPAPANGTTAPAAPSKPRERVAPPLRNGDVYAPTHTAKASLVAHSVSKLVTSPGKTPMDALMPGIKRQALQPDALQGVFNKWAIRVLTLPTIGPFFQRTFDQQLAKAVLGSPYADTSVYVNAAYALSQLAVCSLTEDKYGNVQRDVATIIRTFTTVISKMETFRDQFPTHWTDLSNERQSPVVSEVLLALKDGLAALVAAFGEYSRDLRLTRVDMRLAGQAAEDGREALVRQVAQMRPDIEQLS